MSLVRNYKVDAGGKEIVVSAIEGNPVVATRAWCLCEGDAVEVRLAFEEGDNEEAACRFAAKAAATAMACMLGLPTDGIRVI